MKELLRPKKLVSGFMIPLWVVGLAGLLAAILWISAGSTAHAGPPDGEPNRGFQAGAGPPPGVPQGDSPGFTTGGPGDSTQCILGDLGRIPSGSDDLSLEERPLVPQKCLAAGPGGRPQAGHGPGGGQPSQGQGGHRPGAGGPDPRTLQCIVSVLGRTPTGQNDFTDEEKRLVGSQCFGPHGGGGNPGSGGPGGPGDLSDEELQCVRSTIGRLPSGPNDLTNEEKILLGRACFGGGGHRGGGPGTPGDLDAGTLQCITNTIGRLPSGPEDMSKEEKRRVGQECFGGHQGPGGGGGPGDLTDQEFKCVTETIGRIPTGPDDLTQEEKMLLGRTCFAGHGGPGDIDDETLQCVVSTIGRMPSGPEDLTDQERMLVGRACFNDQGGPDDIGQEALGCIVETIGRLPEGPHDMNLEEKQLVGRVCFGAGGHEGPDSLDEESKQCIIRTLGYLPDSPDELNSEQMDLVIRECFDDGGHEGPGGPMNLDAETEQCIIRVIGFLPQSPNDLTVEHKRLIGTKCFGGAKDSGRSRQGGGQGSPSAGQTRPGGAQAKRVGRSLNLSEETRQCLLEVLGRVPETSSDLTMEEKRLIGQECFGRKTQTRAGSVSVAQPRAAVGARIAVPSASVQPSAPSAGVQASAPASIVRPSAPTAAAAPQPALFLADEERSIQKIISQYNEVDVLDVGAGVIDRLALIMGSKTAAINVLSVVNPLLRKGKQVTNEEWAETFEKLKKARFPG